MFPCFNAIFLLLLEMVMAFQFDDVAVVAAVVANNASLDWVHPSEGSVFTTSCEGDLALDLSLKSNLGEYDGYMVFLNGKTAIKGAYPPSHFPRLYLEPGRHSLKAALLSGDRPIGNQPRVEFDVISRDCDEYAANIVSFEAPFLSMVSPKRGSIFVSPTCAAVVPLEYVWSPYRALVPDLTRAYGGLIEIDGVVYGKVFVRRVPLDVVGCGYHTIKVYLLDADGDVMHRIPEETNFWIENKKNIDNNELIYATPEYSITNFDLKKTRRVDNEPRCLMIVHLTSPTAAYIDGNSVVSCDKDSCSTVISLTDDDDAAPNRRRECSGYLVRILPSGCDEWPPLNTSAECAQILTPLDHVTNTVMITASHHMTYPLQFWEALRNKAEYADVFGYNFWIYIPLGDILGQRSPHFLKIPAILFAFDKNKKESNVLWMDHDTWFVRGLIDTIPLEHYLHSTDADLVFPDLTYDLDDIKELCTAVFFAKDTLWTRSLLLKWWNLSENGEFNTHQAKDQIPLGFSWAEMFTSSYPPPVNPTLTPHQCKQNVTNCEMFIKDFLRRVRRSSITRIVTEPVRIPGIFFHTKNFWPSMLSHEFHRDYLPVHLHNSSFIEHSGSTNYAEYTEGNIFDKTIPNNPTAKLEFNKKRSRSIH